MPKFCSIALIFAVCCCPGTASVAVHAETAGSPTFDPLEFTAKTTAQEKTLLDAGKLHTLGSLLNALKTQLDKEPLALAAPSDAKLDPADVHDRLLASTLVVGLYYHCRDCHQMHFSTGAGFVVAEGGIVTTCAHIMALDSRRMLQAYPVAINARGEVHPIDRIVAFDPEADTVLVHVEGLKAPPLAMRANARIGESVYCLGHPGENPFVFTAGIVSRADARQSHDRTLHSLAVSCDYSPGSSGSPIADASGNVLAQADRILPQLLDVEAEKSPAAAHGASTTYATVYNLRSATGAVEIARLAEPAARPPYTAQPPVAADDAGPGQPSPDPAKESPASSPTVAQVVPASSPVPAPSPAAPTAAASSSPTPGKEPFYVQFAYDLVAAPVTVSMDGITSFEQLYEKVAGSDHEIIVWGDEGKREIIAPSYDPVGFTGNAGYFRKPGASGPSTQENTVSRDVDFRCTFHNRTDTHVGLLVKVNDTRETPEAADNRFEVNAKLAKGVFTLVKLGPPQKNSQAWLAIQADKFDAPQANPVVLQAEGKLPDDKRVDFKFTATDGREVDTTKMRGKVILVDFWATWCGPCVEALPRIQELYDKFHQDGLEVVGINLDEDRAVMEPFLKKHPHPWPQSVSAPSGHNALADRFEIQGIPFFLLIDKTGAATVMEARNPDTDDLIASQLK